MTLYLTARDPGDKSADDRRDATSAYDRLTNTERRPGHHDAPPPDRSER